MFRYLALFLFTLSLFGTDFVSQTQAHKEDERIKSVKQQMHRSDILLDIDADTATSALHIDESPCFNIAKVILSGDKSDKFQHLLQSTLKRLNFKPNLCLGSKSINSISTSLSNAIIAKGYTTSVISIPPQNIKDGTLNLQLTVGKIDKITINDTNSTRNSVSIATAFVGSKKDEVLNLRDLEQGLETITNASKGDVTISLHPSSKQNYSDVNISRQERFPAALSISFDNLGSKATGRYQGGSSVFLLSLLGFNEIFYASYYQNVFKGEKQSVRDETKSGRSNNSYYGISIPFGYFLLDFNENNYKYHQAVPGTYGVYKYSGKSRRKNLTLNYMYYRDQSSKNSLFFRLWEKKNGNFVEDFELDNQRKKTAGYEIGLNSQFFIENGVISLGASYKKSTGAMRALKAPEEEYSEGSSRFEIISLDFGLRKHITTTPFTYDFKFHGSRSKRPLTVQERFNIGGFYSVRGFDGEMSLIGDSGYYARNTLEYTYMRTHAVYGALDVGRVFGHSAKQITGSSLVGTGIGLNGLFKDKSALNYNIFVGTALKKPQYFQTNKAALNFSLNYNF